jgi:thiopeptide-type bacteriocin biosynthesis protein
MYGSTAVLDRLIGLVVSPLLDQLRREGLVAGWFFVRYADPDWQLRLRIKGPGVDITPRALSLLNRIIEPLCAEGLVRKLELGTYEPEFTRYGGEVGMVLAERLFTLDSDAAVDMIQTALADDQHPDWRWQMALCGVDRTLTDFGLSLEERQALVTALYVDLFHEMQKRSAAEDASMLARQLGEKFRRLRSDIECLMSSSTPPAHLAHSLEALRRRSTGTIPVVREVRRLVEQNQLGVPLSDWLRSILHMSVNRLLVSNARHHELVIADFLRRFYKSRIARSAETAPKPRRSRN